MQVIIYNHSPGCPAVILPTQEACDLYGIMETAIKDVPCGKRFKIIDISELPGTPQETWTVDEADLTDGVGGESNEFLKEITL